MANIFYGILNKNTIGEKIDGWIEVAEREREEFPIVFCEKDENLHKFKGRLLDKYDVLSLDDALKRYPDAHVWVTYPKAGTTAKHLLTKMRPEKIHFLEDDLEYRRGCRFLGKFISYRKDTFSPCCVTGKAPLVKASGSVAERIRHWQSYTEKLVDDVRNNKPNDCDKCHLLKEGFYRKTVQLNEINFGSNNKGDVCNFKCTYCFCETTFKRLKEQGDGLSTYEILREISQMPEHDHENFVVQLANGEPCANKDFDALMDVLLDNKWKVVLISNMSIYREKLATIMEQGRVINTLVSMDSGTRETFKKVKRSDMFDRVVENLRRYPIDKANLRLKYIFLEGVNDNEADVDGFYELAKELNAVIVPSADLNKPWNAKIKGLVLRIIEKAQADGIKISTASSYLSKADVRFISENYGK